MLYRALRLGGGESVRVPLLLPKSSRIELHLQPCTTGLRMSVLPERGPPLLDDMAVAPGAPPVEVRVLYIIIYICNIYTTSI